MDTSIVLVARARGLRHEYEGFKKGALRVPEVEEEGQWRIERFLCLEERCLYVIVLEDFRMGLRAF